MDLIHCLVLLMAAVAPADDRETAARRPLETRRIDQPRWFDSIKGARHIRIARPAAARPDGPDDDDTDNRPDEKPDASDDGDSGDKPNEKPDADAELVSHIALNSEDCKYKKGDTLAIQFQMETDGYVYLLYELTDGNMVMLFPNRGRTVNGFAAGATVTLPPDEKTMRFRIGPPYGEEVVVLVVATQPVPELAELDLSSGRAIPVSAEARNALQQRVEADPDKFCIKAARIETSEE